MNGGWLVVAGDDDAGTFVGGKVSCDLTNNLLCLLRKHFCEVSQKQATLRLPGKYQAEPLRDIFNLTRPHRYSMIRLRARRCRRAFDRIEAAHLLIGVATLGEVADITRVARESGVEEVSVERNDDVRFFGAILRLDGLSKGEFRAFQHVVAVDGLVDMPLRLGIDLQQRAQLIGEARRRYRLGEDADARAAKAFLYGQRTLDLFHELGPRVDVAEVRDRLGAVGIVHPEN